MKPYVRKMNRGITLEWNNRYLDFICSLVHEKGNRAIMSKILKETPAG